MSHKAIRDTFLSYFLPRLPNGIDAENDVVYDGQSLNSQLSKKKFIAIYFSPVDAPRTGKSIANSKQNEGFFQVSCYESRNDEDNNRQQFDTTLLNMVDSVQSVFDAVNNIEYNGQEVSITNVRANQLQYDNGYIKQDVTIDFLAYTARV
jgi:hypothetical protein